MLLSSLNVLVRLAYLFFLSGPSILTPSAGVAHHVISLLDAQNSLIPGQFAELSGIDMTGVGSGVMREVMQGITGIRETYILIQDCIALNRPNHLILRLRERLAVLLNRHSITLPSTMAL